LFHNEAQFYILRYGLSELQDEFKYATATEVSKRETEHNSNVDQMDLIEINQDLKTSII
jgi:hypothetical protein